MQSGPPASRARRQTRALLVGLALLLLARPLREELDTLRQDHELGLAGTPTGDLPPELALTRVLMGSLRGLAVDFLWARATRLQLEGRYFELLQLSDWITRLQPGFTQVWVYQAWNLSYNLSVLEDEPADRWRWVRSGIDLLQTRALVDQPHLLELHEELAWLYLHKIGQSHDREHAYYKQRLALEMETILGPPAADPRERLRDLEAIARAHEAFVNREWLTADIVEALRSLGLPDLERRRLEALSLPALSVNLKRKLERGRVPGAARGEGVLRQVEQALREGQLDSRTRFLASHPAAREALDELDSLGLRPGRSLLVGLARPEGRREAGLDRWIEKHAGSDHYTPLLAWCQALALGRGLNLNPRWMVELHDGRRLLELARGAASRTIAPADSVDPLPLDWRHPATHGLYWSSLGLLRSQARRSPPEGERLELARQAIHALRSLGRSGQVVFDRETGYLALTLEPTFFGPTEQFIAGFARDAERLASHPFGIEHREHLRRVAVTRTQLGQLEEARAVFERLEREHPDATTATSVEELARLALEEETDLSHPDAARLVVEGLLFRAIEEGYRRGDGERARQLLEEARQAHERHRELLGERVPTQTLFDRYVLPPPEDQLLGLLTGILLREPDALTPLETQSRIWKQLDPEIQGRLAPRLGEVLEKRARRAGAAASELFPGIP